MFIVGMFTGGSFRPTAISSRSQFQLSQRHPSTAGDCSGCETRDVKPQTRHLPLEWPFPARLPGRTRVCNSRPEKAFPNGIRNQFGTKLLPAVVAFFVRAKQQFKHKIFDSKRVEVANPARVKWVSKVGNSPEKTTKRAAKIFLDGYCMVHGRCESTPQPPASPRLGWRRVLWSLLLGELLRKGRKLAGETCRKPRYFFGWRA